MQQQQQQQQQQQPTRPCSPLCCAAPPPLPERHRFVAKLQGELGPAAVVHHEQPALPHSWAIIPCPSLEQLQQVVPEFIAAEHAAATQRGTDA
jgi:hypothetical protein